MTTIAAGTTSTTALITTTDTTGTLVFQTGASATTALTLDTSQNATFAGSVSFTGVSGSLTLAAGTTTVAPLKFTSGTNLTTPVAGAMEYDGTDFYGTVDTTSGRGYIPASQVFRLTANGGAISTIDSFYGTPSAVTMVPASVYEFTFEVYFLKTTAGTVTFTLTSSQAPVAINAFYVGTPVGGVGTVGTAQTAALVGSTSTAAALPATGSLTTAVQHHYTIKAIVESNATTAGTLKLQAAASAGTILPTKDSYFTATKLPSGNSGIFVA